MLYFWEYFRCHRFLADSQSTDWAVSVQEHASGTSYDKFAFYWQSVQLRFWRKPSRNHNKVCLHFSMHVHVLFIIARLTFLVLILCITKKKPILLETNSVFFPQLHLPYFRDPENDFTAIFSNIWMTKGFCPSPRQQLINPDLCSLTCVLMAEPLHLSTKKWQISRYVTYCY